MRGRGQKTPPLRGREEPPFDCGIVGRNLLVGGTSDGFHRTPQVHHAAWWRGSMPLAARAQQAARVRRISVLLPAVADDPEWQARELAARLKLPAGTLPRC